MRLKDEVMIDTPKTSLEQGYLTYTTGWLAAPTSVPAPTLGAKIQQKHDLFVKYGTRKGNIGS